MTLDAPCEGFAVPIPERQLSKLLSRLAPVRARLLSHPIYAAIDSETRLKVFAQHHVFAVWDFMSLLKALQMRLTCVMPPWLPRHSGLTRRLVNELVLGEESDSDGEGGYTSHFELYVDAAGSFGADMDPVRQLVSAVARGDSLSSAMAKTTLPIPARRFVSATFSSIERGRLSEIAARFALGREDVIPDMFRRFVATLTGEEPGRFGRFLYYLDRHIAIDGEEHGTKSQVLLSEICGDDPIEWKAAELAAIQAIEERLELWDGIYAAVSVEREPAAKQGWPAADA